MEAGKKSKKSKLKKSGVRTKFLIESLRNNYYELREENDRLRNMVKENLDEDAAKTILDDCFDVNAAQQKVGNVDELASQMADTGIEEGDEEDDAVGF
mmetsp:Transcript_19064/g.39442  ORF Transcript_19064/g.39442 Transcript_19064/m.39442 type:complete len:98 (+) Transcript_19064:137-430(+)|eukprot:CAMPEP_0172442424 /NCGR_PEP_ID=MMETSP1065-20121228/2846_1 /TAXON_ID=265537 /ORGANISM="Amphiprora paludosa, Strain CCMP125" /LENGTH=97 /DNA_ID=CAMNT_0013192265 /DNA_START=131 /DNA_END=424 /DNA_ORIENTATION=+